MTDNTMAKTTNDLQNTTYKTEDRVTRTPLKTGGEVSCSVRVSSSCSTRVTPHVCHYCQLFFSRYRHFVDFKLPWKDLFNSLC